MLVVGAWAALLAVGVLANLAFSLDVFAWARDRQGVSSLGAHPPPPTSEPIPGQGNQSPGGQREQHMPSRGW